MRDTIRELLDEQSTPAGRAIGLGIMTLIILSCTAVIVETVPSLPPWCRPWLRRFEILSVAAFTVEYVLRLWSAPSLLRRAIQPMMLIDVFSVLPFYIGLFVVSGVDLRFLRILRALRILRLLKMQRYSKALSTLAVIMKVTRHRLLSFLFVAALSLIFVASAIFHVEPETFGSIPDALWWSVVTLTTVGYGDIVPATTLGRFLAAIVMLIGIGIIAIPTSIISSAMTDYYEKHLECACPECGEQCHDLDAVFCKKCGHELRNLECD